MNRVQTVKSRLFLFLTALWILGIATAASAQGEPAPTAQESELGELLITADAQDVRPRLAILPSLSPDLEDVIVRGVVRGDFELTGLFRMVDDAKAPPGLYGFDDPVDVKAWRNIGTEIIVKLAARKQKDQRVEVLGIAYLMSAGERPVYKKRILVQKEDIRVTAHRITDALLGALTGREGGFASRLAFAAKWGRNHTIFTVDADGHNIVRQTDPDTTSIAPSWGPEGYLFYTESKDYAPFVMKRLGEKRSLDLPFGVSIYSVAFSPDGKRLAVSAGAPGGSAIFVGNSDGTDMQKVSSTDLSIRPVFSPSGKLAWIGGEPEHGSQRVYVDGKPVSPSGFSAASPTFCDTEDGIRLVFSVSIGRGKRDLVMTGETGGKMHRLTQNGGANAYPACSPDGRMIAYFSQRKGETGLFVKSLKTFADRKISSRSGESLAWARLPPPSAPQPTNR